MSNKRVILVGARVVSATLATLIKKIEPEWEITIFERLEKASEESPNLMFGITPVLAMKHFVS